MKKLLLILLLVIPLVHAVPIFPKEVIFFDRLVANNEQTKMINNVDVRFTSVGVTTNKDVTRARIIVQAMPDCPENAPYQENVLQCFFVSSNFDENKITSFEIEFKVPKSWIKQNNFGIIELRRYSYSWNNNLQGNLSNWKPLKTILMDEDDEYNYYKAYSDGIDYFSIVGKEVEKKVVVNKSNKITAQVVKEIPIAVSHNNNYLPFVMILAILALFVSFIPSLNKKESTQFEQLTTYIKESKGTEEEIKNELKNNGWEDWQINLAFREIKK